MIRSLAHFHLKEAWSSGPVVRALGLDAVAQGSNPVLASSQDFFRLSHVQLYHAL